MAPRSSTARGDGAASQPSAKASPAASKAESVVDMDDNDETVDTKPATANADASSTVTDKELDAMHMILKIMYEFRTAEGEDPSKLFHRKVNRRMVPDYYDVIKEPMAMSTIKAKLNNREYKSFEEFVRDWALICHNAQVYNSPNALAYVNALILKDVVARELAKIADNGVVEKERTTLPFLGDIPPAEEVLAQEEEEEDEDEEEEEDDDEDSEEEGKKKKRGRGRPSLASKRESKMEVKEKDDDPDLRKKRGRPPRVDTPLEARIKAVMKGLRKPKNSEGELMILSFERLPDKADLPDYFNEIKNPIALDGIKRKLKRKKYTSVDQFMKDIDLMFENAKQYNTDESVIYQDAVELQAEAQSLAEQEKKKPDSEFTMEDGRIPLPQGILHNGELWRVGDWVHIQNTNDLTKPIVAQIYRTWQDPDGSKWVNACWYYRPEQTVHRFDRHFWEGEVMKTGQYRDHPIDEVVDRCFVMFFTRYNKGRPRGFPKDKDVYVCECRYNEEKHKLNKIKTWASCLPDEVRDKDYEMDLFDQPKKLKKVLSPISYTLPKDAKETDELPKPKWGAPNAPPTIGAVHTRPRDPKDSPPPEPTPTPPPQPPPQPVRQMSHHQSNGYASDRPSQINIAAANTPRHANHIAPTPQAMQTPGSYAPGTTTHNTQYNPSPSPAPILQQGQHNGYNSHLQQPFPHHQPQQPLSYSGPLQGAPIGARQTQGPPPVAYKAPNPVEVWHLPDNANASIPAEIRDQFQQDAQGRVLFFTAPPAAPTETKKKLQHTPGYLAFRAKQMKEKLDSKKRNAEDTTGGAEVSREAKKSRTSSPQIIAQDVDMEVIQKQAFDNISNMLVDSTVAHLRALHGEEGLQKAVDAHLNALTSVWESNAREQQAREAGKSQRIAADKAKSNVGGLTRLLNYRPPNEHLEWRSRG